MNVINKICAICGNPESDHHVFVEKFMPPGTRARKIGGSYQATGEIVASWIELDGKPRYVFRFDQPPGLLHIFTAAQVAAEG